MEIEIQTLVPEVKKININFPIYRAHHLSDDDDNACYYTRITEDLEEITIYKCENYRNRKIEYKLEIEPNYCFDNSDINYHLGQGIYKSSQKEFNQVLEQMKQAINKIKSYD